MIKRFLVAVPVLLTIQFAHAQTADEIIAKYIQAIGGSEKLGSINSVKMDMTMSIMGGESAASTTILNGKGFRNESDFNGQKIVQVVTDKSGWAINPMGGGAPEAMPDAIYKSSEDQVFIFPLLNYSTHGAKAELAGKEKVNNTDVYKLVVTNKDGVPSTFLIDASTYLIVQTIKQAEMMGNTIDMITTYSDYKPSENGILLPNSIETSFGGNFSMTAKMNKAEFNTTVDPAIFEMK